MEYRVLWWMFVLVVLDQVTKFYLAGVERIDLFFELAITGSFNTGSAWGMFAGISWYPLLVVFLSLVLLVALFLAHHRGYLTSYWLRCMALFAGAGIIGNALDRIFLGGVRDFIDVFGWFVCNLADCYLSIAVVCMVLHECSQWKLLKRINMSKG